MRAESAPQAPITPPAAAKWAAAEQKELIMEATQPAQPAQPLPTAPARARNGLGVAALVIGVASLVAAISFLLFPLGLVGGLVGLVIAIIALTRGRHRGATNSGQAIAGLVCSVLALIVAIGLTVQLGTWAARNTGVFTRFDNCIAHAGNRGEVSACIARFADEVRQ
jgi:Na+/H+ antiporter NhaD/arsenite permease-like protein